MPEKVRGLKRGDAQVGGEARRSQPSMVGALSAQPLVVPPAPRPACSDFVVGFIRASSAAISASCGRARQGECRQSPRSVWGTQASFQRAVNNSSSRSASNRLKSLPRILRELFGSPPEGWRSSVFATERDIKPFAVTRPPESVGQSSTEGERISGGQVTPISDSPWPSEAPPR